MYSLTFVLALALAIACISVGSTRAAPAFAKKSCQAQCKNGENCNGNSCSSLCIPCFNCTALNPEFGAGSRAKSVAEWVPQNHCRSRKYDHPEYNDRDKEGRNSANDTELEASVRVLGPGKHPTDKLDVQTKDTDDGQPSLLSNNSYVTIFLASAGILAVFLVSLLCALRPRPRSLVQGGWRWAKGRRLRKLLDAHLRDLRVEYEVGQPGTDWNVQFYDQNEGQLARILVHQDYSAAPFEADNSESHAGNLNESVNDSSLCDNDNDEWTDHDVPQSPSPIATQMSKLGPEDRVSDSTQ